MNKRSHYKILCVDDESNMLSLFHRLLGRKFNILTAESAAEALLLIEQNPDIAVIISDHAMPHMNGMEFLKLARQKLPLTILLMLTGNAKLDIAVQVINETDIFHYLPKPCPKEILDKTIDEAIRQFQLLLDKQQLTQQLTASNLQLEQQKYLLEFELEMAKAVFSKLNTFQDETINGLDYVIKPKDIVGGDFLLTYVDRAQQTMFIMMGDLTGHGLESALAAMLVTDAFDTLTPGNPSIVSLAAGINEKMLRKLPRNFFCASVLVKLDIAANRLSIWHAGTPDICLFSADGTQIDLLRSTNLALGIASEQYFENSAQHFAIDELRSIFVYSDGITDQRNPQKHMFGQQRLLDALQNCPTPQKRVNFVMQTLQEHQLDERQNDDISLFELHLPELCRNLERS
jgi:two-component system, HptB-dependent secretion and biofilm response regulator